MNWLFPANPNEIAHECFREWRWVNCRCNPEYNEEVKTMAEEYKKYDSRYERDYRISATKEEHLNMLDKLFEYIQYLGRVGSSRKLEVYVDGDGPVNLRFYKKGSDDTFWKLDSKEVEELPSGYGVIKTENGEKKYFDLG